MRDMLHDEIDQYEAWTEAATKIVDGTREALRGIKQIDVPFDDLLQSIAEVVGDALAPLTTEAARGGMAMAKCRASRAGK
jgi:hypothetical protein